MRTPARSTHTQAPGGYVKVTANSGVKKGSAAKGKMGEESGTGGCGGAGCISRRFGRQLTANRPLVPLRNGTKGMLRGDFQNFGAEQRARAEAQKRENERHLRELREQIEAQRQRKRRERFEPATVDPGDVNRGNRYLEPVLPRDPAAERPSSSRALRTLRLLQATARGTRANAGSRGRRCCTTARASGVLLPPTI